MSAEIEEIEFCSALIMIFPFEIPLFHVSMIHYDVLRLRLSIILFILIFTSIRSQITSFSIMNLDRGEIFFDIERNRG